MKIQWKKCELFFLGYLVVPYDIAFGEALERELYQHSVGPKRMILVTMRILYFFFILDIIINFITGLYTNETKTFIMDPKTIAK